MSEQRERTEIELAMLNDPLLHATVMDATYALMMVDRARQDGDDDDEQYREKMYLALGRAFFTYHKILRDDRARMQAEIVRLRSLIVEPLKVGGVEMKSGGREKG